MKKFLKVLSAFFVGIFAFIFASCEKTPTPTPETPVTPEVTPTPVQGFNVYFYAFGKTADPETIKNVTEIPSTLPSLTVEGFTFEGWFYDIDLSKPVQVGDELKDNVTLFAKLTEVAVTPDSDIDLSKYDLITIARALEIASENGEDAGETRYYIHGIIKTVSNPEYGEMVITDGTNEIYVYGTYGADGEDRYAALDERPVAGDEVVLSVLLNTHNNEPQVKSGWIQEFVHNEPEINLNDYAVKTIAEAREVEEGTKVKVTGVVAAITKANGHIPNGVFLVADSAAIYVYGIDVAGQVKVGNTITVAAEKDYYILDSEIQNAQKYGYEGANQLSNAILLENDKGVSEIDFSWTTEKTVKEIMNTPVTTENITTNIYKVNAYVNKVPGNGFVNYYINDLDNETGSYVYTQCNGSDFEWLDEFNGEICTVYLSAINCKSTPSGCFYRFVPVAVIDEDYEFDLDLAPEFVYEYAIKEQFLPLYNADPAIELTTSVSYEGIGVENATVEYTALTTNANIEIVEDKQILHILSNGTAKIKVLVTLGENTYEDIIEIEFESPDAYTAITVAEATAKEVGEEVILEGIVAGSLVNQMGFYLIDNTGTIAVKGAETVINLLSVGDKVAIKGKRDQWGTKEGEYIGQVCVNDCEVIVNYYGNHAYDKSNFIKDKDIKYIYDLDYQEQHSNEVYVVKAKIEFVETAYYTSFKITSLDGNTKINAYCSSANQYKWLKEFNGKEIDMELVLCNWNGKNYYTVCVLSVTVEGETYYNTLNFAD